MGNWLDSTEHIKTSTEGFYHSGIPGMKWYNRRYQYEDGTYTEEGKARRRKGYSERSSGTNSNTSNNSSFKSHPKALAEEFDLAELEKELSDARVQRALSGYYYNTKNDRVANKKYNNIQNVKNVAAIIGTGAVLVGGGIALKKALDKYGAKKTSNVIGDALEVANNVPKKETKKVIKNATKNIGRPVIQTTKYLALLNHSASYNIWNPHNSELYC